MQDHSAIVFPLRGIRYQTADSRDLSALITPPYDVISPELRADLLARHPHNFVNVELPSSSFDEGEQPYARAAAVLQDWLSEGVLVKDPEPSLYLLEQEFTFHDARIVRRGVFGAVRLPEHGERYVLAHEGTLAAPKQDRLELMRACRAMTSPVMAIYPDPQSRLREALEKAADSPTVTANDAEGVIHRLCRISDPSLLEEITSAVGPGPLAIADGHHRFETAVTYRDEMRRLHPEAGGEAELNYALLLIASAQDPGLIILPTHRLLDNLSEEMASYLRREMNAHFRVQRRALPDLDGLAPGFWLEGMAAENHAFAGYWGGDEFCVFTAGDDLTAGGAGPVDGVDVTILHRHLIDPARAACEEKHGGTLEAAACPRITYVTDEREALAMVRRGEKDCVFLVRPTRVADVLAVAEAGDRMPGKSTYFFPKVPAGLVILGASAAPR